jgi:hypothetical protein
MKTKKTYLLILLVLMMNTVPGKEPERSISIYDPSESDLNTRFKLVRSNNNICIYARWIPVNETRSSRQLKAEFLINCKAEKVLSILRDEKTYTKWMKASRTCIRLKTINSNQWYSYIQFSIPWPLNNQDCILKYEVRKDEELSRTEISLVSAPDLLKPFKDIERISHMEGLWIITQTGPERTSVEYYVCSKQEPKFPTWITAPLIEKNFLNTMTAFRDVVMNDSK